MREHEMTYKFYIYPFVCRQHLHWFPLRSSVVSLPWSKNPHTALDSLSGLFRFGSKMTLITLCVFPCLCSLFVVQVVQLSTWYGCIVLLSTPCKCLMYDLMSQFLLANHYYPLCLVNLLPNKYFITSAYWIHNLLCHPLVCWCNPLFI